MTSFKTQYKNKPTQTVFYFYFFISPSPSVNTVTTLKNNQPIPIFSKSNPNNITETSYR